MGSRWCSRVLLVVLAVGGTSSREAATAVQSAAGSSSAARAPWQAAKLKGLTVGVSTREDMRRVLGEATRQWVYEGRVESDPRSVTHFIYRKAGELGGDLSVDVVTGTGTIVGMAFEFEFMTAERAIDHLGPGHVRTRYELCPGGAEDVWILDGPIYETPEGSLEYIEYRERGIAFRVDSSDLVNEIMFLGTNGVGLRSTSECAERLESDRRDGGRD